MIYEKRPFRWINLWTPFDVLGGCLDFYATPPDDGDANEERIENIEDPLAITPLSGHTEFWKNTLLYETIYGELERPASR